MKQKQFLRKVKHGISCYFSCHTCHYIPHKRQQKIIKEHLTFVECSRTN